MKLKFEAPKGRRFYKQFRFIQQINWLNGEWDKSEDFVYDEIDGKWIDRKQLPEGHYFNNGGPCHSVKAFQRMLKKNPHMKGRLVLVHRYVGFNVLG
jgi:hypothetical protein